MDQKLTGWLILEEAYPHKPVEFQVDEEENQEAPYSDDNNIYQFHIELDFSGDYPVLRGLTDR